MVIYFIISAICFITYALNAEECHEFLNSKYQEKGISVVEICVVMVMMSLIPVIRVIAALIFIKFYGGKHGWWKKK